MATRMYKQPDRRFLGAKAFRIGGDLCKLIPLTQGLYAIVDADNYEYLSQFNWQAIWSPRTWSFRAVRRQTAAPGKYTTVLMHREVLRLSGFVDFKLTDHAETKATLTNTRKNLRPASYDENAQNTPWRRHNTSGFKGVYLHKASGKYAANIGVRGKRIHLGLRDTARRAYEELYVPAATQYHGEFANLTQEGASNGKDHTRDHLCSA